MKDNPTTRREESSDSSVNKKHESDTAGPETVLSAAETEHQRDLLARLLGKLLAAELERKSSRNSVSSPHNASPASHGTAT